MPPKASTSGSKLSVPAFLKLLTSGGVGLSATDALSIIPSLVKAGYNTSSANPFAGCTDSQLVSAGIKDFDVRKILIAYGRSGKGKTVVSDEGGHYRKRKTKDSDLDTPLRDGPEEKEVMSLDFQEETEDYLLIDRGLQINRAPVMTAWATVVAERLGFTRQEALSIAHTYTNMNATSKGVSLGIYSPEKGKQKTEVGPSQPYVELMGRKIPMLALQNGEWRGIANGAIAEPEQAFGYIFRSMRQQMSAAMGALKLLADSFEPEKLNEIGYQLYAEFRPEVKGWGEKGRLELSSILDLRHKPKAEEPPAAENVEDPAVKAELVDDTVQPIAVKAEEVDTSLFSQPQAPEEPPPSKKVKREPCVADDEFGDGGLSDSDLLGLV